MGQPVNCATPLLICDILLKATQKVIGLILYLHCCVSLLNMPLCGGNTLLRYCSEM